MIIKPILLKEEQIIVVEGNIWDMEAIIDITLKKILPRFWERFGGNELIIRYRKEERYVAPDKVWTTTAELFRKILQPEFIPFRACEEQPRFKIGDLAFSLVHAYPHPYFIEDKEIIIDADDLIEERQFNHSSYPSSIANYPYIAVNRWKTGNMALLSDMEVVAIEMIVDELMGEAGLEKMASRDTQTDYLIMGFQFSPSRYLLRRDKIMVEYLSFTSTELSDDFNEPLDEEMEEKIDKMFDKLEKKGQIN